MFAKIFIDEKAYEVNLLSAEDVIQEIKSELADSVKELTKENNLENVICQFIDDYEKVEYKDKEYFIHKSDLPLIFKNKTYGKKYMSSDEIAGRLFSAIALPVTYITANIFGLCRNIINMISAKSIGRTKIHQKYTGRDIFFTVVCMIVINALFYTSFAVAVRNDNISAWSIIGLQFVNLYLAMTKPFNFQYNKIENYKLAPYTFDSKYEDIHENAIDKLKAMKVSVDKKKIDFDFSDGNEKEDKEKNYVTY